MNNNIYFVVAILWLGPLILSVLCLCDMIKTNNSHYIYWQNYKKRSSHACVNTAKPEYYVCNGFDTYVSGDIELLPKKIFLFNFSNNKIDSFSLDSLPRPLSKAEYDSLGQLIIRSP